jgi:hypothetical protein
MSKGEQVRLTAWRLKISQQAADEQNVARVCRRSPGHSGTPGRNAQRTLRVKEPLPETRDPSLRTRLQDMPLTYARVCLDDGH